MRILWLNPNLLLPLDKGGKLRTWHLMRHLARAPRDHVSVVRRSGRSRRATVDGMSEVCAELVTDSATRTRQRGRCGSTPASRGTCSIRCRMRSRKYRSRAYRARGRDRARRRSATIASSATFWCPRSICRGALPCPAVLFTHNVEAEIWRRHAETATRLARQAAVSAQWRRMLRFEDATLARFDRRARRLGRRSRHVSRGSIPDAARRRSRSIPTGVDTDYFAPGAERIRRSTPRSSSPARWTGCRTSTRCSSSAARSCRSSARGAGRDVHDRRTRADAAVSELAADPASR